MGQTIFKLVLPTSLSRQVLEAIHMKFETHQNTDQLARIFGSTFSTKNLRDLARNVVDSCLLCTLCTKQGKTTTGGAQRTFDNNQIPGRIWVSDMCYLPPCKLGNKFAMILCEQLSSYVVVFPTADLRSQTMAAVLRQFLSIFPRPELWLSDYGSEYSSIFTTELRKYHVKHHEGVPNRSQIQGSAELVVKLTKLTRTKLVGLHSGEGKNHWS